MFRIARVTLPCLALLLASTACDAIAQGAAESNGGSTSPFTPIPRSQRPKLAVKDFEFQAQLSREDQAELNSYASVIFALRGGNPALSAQTNANNLAKSTSQLLTERLRNSAQFRVFEREQLASVTSEQDLVASERAKDGQEAAKTGELLGANYVVTGAITKFGKSKKQKKGVLGGIISGALGGAGVSSSQTEYEVGLTVKVIESSTGEVVASATTDGVVQGDTERKLAAMGGLPGKIIVLAGENSASGEREKRISEALLRAIDLVVIKLVDAREKGDIEP